MSAHSTFWRSAALLAVLGTLAGCGGETAPDRPDLGDVSGVVTLDGQPLPDVIVTFNPEKGRPSMGRTDAEGKYVLHYLDEDGAVLGTHTVSITTPQEAPTPLGEEYQDPIPAKYNTQTTLTETVEAGDNTINFELQSK